MSKPLNPPPASLHIQISDDNWEVKDLGDYGGLLNATIPKEVVEFVKQYDTKLQLLFGKKGEPDDETTT